MQLNAAGTRLAALRRRRPNGEVCVCVKNGEILKLALVTNQKGRTHRLAASRMSAYTTDAIGRRASRRSTRCSPWFAARRLKEKQCGFLQMEAARRGQRFGVGRDVEVQWDDGFTYACTIVAVGYGPADYPVSVRSFASPSKCSL